ncbi:uncharacterized protein FFC1_02215 [Fusarium fujikuroi]|nr:uncharacterized protein FFC1_02215 [Fusarium fujikuroi]
MSVFRFLASLGGSALLSVGGILGYTPTRVGKRYPSESGLQRG